jgi:hypothetical protein
VPPEVAGSSPDLIYGFELRWGMAEEEGEALGQDRDDPVYRADLRTVESWLVTVTETLDVRPQAAHERLVGLEL